MMRLACTVLLLLYMGTTFAQNNYCIAGRFSENYCFDSSQIKVTTGISYAVSARWPSAVLDTLQLDVFEPEASFDTLSKRPLIMLIHGGAFLAGARADMHYQCMEYARRGFVVASISYRLGWNCSATDLLGVCVFCQGENYNLQTATYRAVQDARAALRFLSTNALTYGIDTAWLFVGGESAGSITALHTAFWDQQEANVFASWATGEVGLLDTAGNSLPNNYSIKGVIDNCGALNRDSVILNNGNIPVVSFHDENDCVVPAILGQVISCTCQAFYWVQGSSAIHSLMNNAGLCNEMNLVPLSINHCSYPSWNLVRHASCFLKRLMCGDCNSGFINNTGAPVSCDTLNQFISSIPSVKVNNESPLLYFPNPSSGQITFDLSNLLSRAPLEISITDAAGKIVEVKDGITQPAYVSQTRFNTTGVYFIALLSNHEIIAKGKLIAGY